jgi:hypothetical protein
LYDELNGANQTRKEGKRMAEKYTIRLKGHFNPSWADYFEGFSQQTSENGETILTGEVIDQTALHGFLTLIRDLGIPLLEVKQVSGFNSNN